MNAEEIRGKQPSKSGYDGNGRYKPTDGDIARASFEAVRELAAQVAEANESLKCLARPMLGYDVNKADLSGVDLQPGKITFRPTQDVKTLRDEIAIAALAAIISRGDLDTEMNVTPYCQDAYTIADAMIEARKR